MMQTRRDIFAIAAGAMLGLAPDLAWAAGRPFTLVMLGDSLTAGYGLAREEAPPAQIEQRLRAQGLDIKIVNAGSSGDLAAGGLARLDWSVPPDADGVLIELGANDMLQGRPVAKAKADLTAIVKRLKARAKPPIVALAGMKAQKGLDPVYRRQFEAIYPDLARAENIALYPFFLDGVALDPKLVQADGLHPNPKGAGVLAERITPFIEKAFRLRVPAKPA